MAKMVEYSLGKSPLIPAKPLGVSCHIWNIFGITFEPETLETQSRALKTCILT